jgi:hypothetical protein
MVVRNLDPGRQEGIGISRYKEGTLLTGSAIGASADYIFVEGNAKTRG